MEYRRLGATGLKVSAISLGNMINYKAENVEIDDAVISRCLEHGINFFDTAELYADGECEKALGRGIARSKVDRQDVVISTKIWKIGSNVNFVTNTNRKHIIESLDLSLKRLNMDYVDVVFAHAYDPVTPMEEICRGFNHVIEEGKAFYWATSNWDAQAVYEAFEVCDRLGLHRPVADQAQYNMLTRKTMEVEYETLFDRHHYGVTAWSPLCGGFLTGKYLDSIPEGTRLSEDLYFSKEMMKKFFYEPHNTEKVVKSVRELQNVSKELGCSLTQLALAWVLYNKNISTAIVGARNVAQLDETVKALDVYKKWTPELDAKVGAILDNAPTAKTNYSNFSPGAKRRP